MFRQTFIFFLGIICFTSLMAQDHRYDIWGNQVKCGTKDFDSLYRHVIPFVNHYADSIKFYENEIESQIDITIIELKGMEFKRKDEIENVIKSLNDYKVNY